MESGLQEIVTRVIYVRFEGKAGGKIVPFPEK